MIIKIQKKNFNIENEIKSIKKKYDNVGAISIFLGYVRNTNNNKKVISIDLEVYPEMAKKSLEKICNKVKRRYKIQDILIIHRYGKLKTNQKIVLVATLSAHRKDSIKSCEYIINYLKKDAPFWKKEEYKKKISWI